MAWFLQRGEGMTVCATCGRRLDGAAGAQRICPSCTWQATAQRREATTVNATSPDRPVALAARLHDLALIVGERLNPGSVELLEAVARGNVRLYDSEVTRLANRYIERLEDTWDA